MHYVWTINRILPAESEDWGGGNGEVGWWDANAVAALAGIPIPLNCRSPHRHVKRANAVAVTAFLCNSSAVCAGNKSIHSSLEAKIAQNVWAMPYIQQFYPGLRSSLFRRFVISRPELTTRRSRAVQGAGSKECRLSYQLAKERNAIEPPLSQYFQDSQPE